MKHLLITLALLPTVVAMEGQQIVFPQDQKLRYAEKLIETYYVDTVDTPKMVEAGIKAMLKTLDPHSEYTNAEETKEITSPLDGNFSGIGVQFQMLNDTLFVIQTTAGGPSEAVGILPGDRILMAGDSLISGAKRPNSGVMKLLRGEKGTVVELKVLRRGYKEPMTFRVVRDEIPLYSVDAAYMADPETGYIRISRFGEETDAEFSRALRELRRQGMKNLILDLEDNGGGYLGAAHKIASHFLQRNDLVVYQDSPTMGKQVMVAERRGDVSEGRLVVMVNQYSASAAEITAGAVQDNDRGLIVGRRTFGKGLVQRPFPFPDGSMIRLTVSKYYTPSGRCIQKPYTAGDQDKYREDLIERYKDGEYFSADSVRLSKEDKYKTLRNGRTVYGGGGIMPDLYVPVDTTAFTPLYRKLLAHGIINRYCVTYVDEHRKGLQKDYPTEEDYIARFEVTDKMIDEVMKMGAKDSIEENAEEKAVSTPMLRTVLKALIGRDLFTTATYFKITNPELNPVYKEALKLINDIGRYYPLLHGEKVE